MSLSLNPGLSACPQSVGHDAENLRRILDQITALHADPTSRTSEPSVQLTPLKVLTELLKQTRTSTTWSSSPDVHLSHKLTNGVDLVLKEMQSLNRKIDLNLQVLQPCVSFLKAAQQVLVSSHDSGSTSARA